MKLIFQKIQNIFVEEAQNINTKIKGINFLEILKFKLLEKIVEIEEINTYKSSENAQNEFIYENDNLNIKFKLSFIKFANSKPASYKLIENDILIICLFKTIEINIEDYKTKKNHIFKLNNNSGITMPKNTKCKIISNQDTFLIEIFYEDKSNDIEN